MKYETSELTSETRSMLPGSFIKLTDGYTHYELEGPQKANLIVLVHGFVTPYFAWDKQIKEFVNQGYQVLRYDLYGRGFSDRPDLKYDYPLFVRQLHELLKELNLDRKGIILAGWSMGGGICINFINAYPEIVRKLVLVAPVGFSSRGLSSSMLLKIPLLSKLIFYNLGHKIMLKRIESVLKIEDRSSEEFKQVTEQMEYRGFLKALLSNITHMNMNHLESAYKEVGKLGFPKMLIWGQNDSAVHFELHKEVIKYLDGIIFHPLKEVGHAPQYNDSKRFNELVLEFIND